MLTFFLFAVAVIVYVAFLLWCFAPIFRQQRRRWFGFLRVALGLLLLSANLFPPLAWPIILLLTKVHPDAIERAQAVILFPWTFPKYALNILEYQNATAIVVGIDYPIEISGVRYKPQVRIACTTRRAIFLDKGIDVRSIEKFTTASSGDFLAWAGDAIIAIDHSFQICSFALRKGLQPGPFPYMGGGTPAVFIVRGEAENTQLYSLRYDFSPTASVDDILIHPPEIVSVYKKPARDMISLDDLWPMRRSKDHSLYPPAMIKAYKQLPATENACVMYVTLVMRAEENKPDIYRTHKTNLRKVPLEKRPDFCRDVLARRIPPPPKSRLIPDAR